MSDLCLIELLEIELFLYLSVCEQKTGVWIICDI